MGNVDFVLYRLEIACGKSMLAQILAGQISEFQGIVFLTDNFASLSFELEALTLEQDRLNDKSDFMAEGIDKGRTAIEVIISFIVLEILIGSFLVFFKS